MLGLIIDDGVPSRGHRTTMFSDKYNYVGIYAVKCGDKINTCMDYHTEDLKTIESSKNPLTTNVKPPSKGKIAPKQNGGYQP